MRKGIAQEDFGGPVVGGGIEGSYTLREGGGDYLVGRDGGDGGVVEVIEGCCSAD